MRKCPQCEQVYDDETNFCLADGSTLVSYSFDSLANAPTIVADLPYDPPLMSASSSETPTVVGNSAYAPPLTSTSSSETPTVMSNFPYTPPPTSVAPAKTQMVMSNSPLIPPVYYAQPGTNKSSALLIGLAVGFFALIFGGAIVGLVIYGLSDSDNVNAANAANSSDRSNKSGQHDNDDLAANLKRRQEDVERDKQKLEDDRKALEAKKKQAAQTPRPSNAATATIIDPPSNIRATPNGAVICVIRQRGTIVNILGPTGVSDNNGTWYYTDACGRTGVIHSSQIRF